MLHRAIARAGAGDVIVARCGGALHGYWGEVMTVAALSRGIVGLVIDGSVRDVKAIRELGFPVYAAGVAPAGTGKLAEGSVGAPIELRGAASAPVISWSPTKAASWWSRATPSPTSPAVRGRAPRKSAGSLRACAWGAQRSSSSGSPRTDRLASDPAGVHEEIGSCDERGAARGHEADCLGDLGGIRPAAERLFGLPLRADIG